MGFQNVLKKAKAVKEQQSQGFDEGERDGGFKQLYPIDGTLKMRFLYNKKSDDIFRVIKHHWVTIGGKRRTVPCLEEFGLPCPMCNIKEEYMNHFNKEKKEVPYQLNVTKRAIAFVTEQPESKNKDDIGATKIWVGPISVMKEFSDILITYSEEEDIPLETLISNPAGYMINVKKFKDGQQTKYSTTVAPMGKTIRSVPKGDTPEQEQEEMDKFLDSLPALEDVVEKSKYEKWMLAKVEEAAKATRIQYGLPPVAPASAKQQSEPVTTTTPVESKPTVDDDLPPRP